MKLLASISLSLLAMAGLATEPASAQPVLAPAVRADTSLPALTGWWLRDPIAGGAHGIGVDRAYAELLAGRQPVAPVIVAILDSGVDTAHVDLRGSLWSNPRELAGNGKDDDGNGYVDDVRGWSFLGNPDGRNIQHDTKELTRLYAACSASPRRSTLDVGTCERIRQNYEEEKAENAQILGQIDQILPVVERAEAILKQALAGKPLTPENVESIQSIRSDVSQSRMLYLQLAGQGLTPEKIRKAREEVRAAIEYGLNPAFDPRPIIGDDYADGSQRVYGNTDVTGPDATHGTHVAGIVAATRGNGIGIDGVAPAVQLMIVRVVPDGDERDKDVANAIRYAVDNGARVINMSFGKGYSPEKSLVDEAVRYAESKGVLLVHAAGNSAADLALEANFPNAFIGDVKAANWIEVGATSPFGADSLVATFSNYGRAQVDVFAPGVDIVSTVPGGGYEANSGTSMAAPVVSGVAALILNYYPGLTAVDVKQAILESATRLSDLKVMVPGAEPRSGTFGELSATGGIVNAYAALQRAAEIAASKKGGAAQKR